jgi:hypothetical protein
MSRLALFAMLLLALAPSVSRLLAVQSDSASGWTEVCSVQGLKWLKLPQDPSGDHGTPGHDSGDCAYCPLSRSLDNAVATIALPIAPHALAISPGMAPRAAPSRWSYPSGLGSRGPPALS